MKLKMESKELKDIETGVIGESNSQRKEDSKENTSDILTTSNGSQLEEKPMKSPLKIDETDQCIQEDSVFGLVNQLDHIKCDQNKIALEENFPAAEVSNESLNIEDSKIHRQNIQYFSESSDFETDEESTDSDEFFKNLHKNVILPSAKLPTVVKTKGELLPFDLPPVEDLRITEKVTNLQKIGKILHTVIAPERNEFFVIVEADGNSNPLDEDSVLFLSSGKPLGKIHDVFGNVNKPNYVVRFNNAEDIDTKGVAQGQDVFYSPSNSDLTHYVLVDDLKQQKGSDASWKDNNEPPDDQIDYSDDEQEKMAKRKRKAKNRKNDRDCDSEEEVEDVTPMHIERRRVAYNQERAFQARSPRNKFQSPMPGSSPQSYTSPRSYDSAPSPPSTFNPGSSGLQRNAHLSQPNGPNMLNNRFGGFQQRSVPSHQSFPQSNMPSHPSFGSSPQSNMQSHQSFGTFPQSNMPSATPFGPFTQNRGPTPQSFGTFPPSTVPSHQPFSPPPNSHVFMPPNVAASNTSGILQQNPQSLMHAPQNNVPLQQQIILQSQQPAGNFLSHPPPNYNSNQNPRTFLHQNHSFTPPTFGALPAAIHTMPNTSNQPFVNQIVFRTNGPHNNLSGNLNISQPRNITPMNNQQNPLYNMVQSTTGNSFMFPSRNTQHTLVSQPSFGPNQLSPCKTPPFIANQSTLPSPCSTPPFVLCPTPPPLPTQQCFAIQSNQHPAVLPSQTPPPTLHQFSLNLPVVRNPMLPQHYPYS